MTNWTPTIERGGNPLYIELADAIERDIDAGTLKPGYKLPPQRNLAYDIGVTVGTVTRAYALARERSLVYGEVGRGTYVLGADNAEIQAFPLAPELDKQKVSAEHPFNAESAYNTKNLGFASATNIGQSPIISNVAANIANGHPAKLIDYVRQVPDNWLKAGQSWLSCGGWTPDLKSIVPTNGTHAAVVSVISAITNAGDKIVFEGLTYCSFSRSAQLLGRRVLATPFDQHGIIPEEFEKLCAQQHPKMLFMMPSVQNPTLSRLPEERRKAIAEIAQRYQVWLVEDSVYAPLVDDSLPPVAKYAPELTFHVGGLSKSVSAGIRGGWVACPPRYSGRIATTHKLVTGGAAFWLMELSAELVLGGHAAKISKKIQSENKKRTDIAIRVFAGANFMIQAHCPYLWLKLPEPWHSNTFKTAVGELGITISSEDDFKLSREVEASHCVRIGLSSPNSATELETTLQSIRNVLDSGIAGYDIDG